MIVWISILRDIHRMIEAQHADHRALERKGSLTFVQQTSARNRDRNPSVEISPGGRPCPFWRQSGGVHTKTGATTIERRLADAVAFGRMFIANPDLPARIWTGAPLTFDQSTSQWWRRACLHRLSHASRCGGQCRVNQISCASDATPQLSAPRG